MKGMDERYAEIDLLRTLAIVCMIVYHAAFDLAFFHDFPLDPTAGGWFLLQRFTVNVFLFVVGASFAISYGNMERSGVGTWAFLIKYAKRALFLLACATGISVVTFLFIGDAWIRFGALHLIGTAILLLPLLMPLREGTAVIGAGILMLSLLLPRSSGSILLLPLGVPPLSFVSVDYLPLIPWMAPILFGTALGNALYNRRLLRHRLPEHRWITLIALPGRHALAIYLLHQPVILALLWLFI